ncbi:MAG TPA: dipeptidase [Nocardioides sp.]|uniref:dipeptidase n=1 Tax=Nocardioides sp. TaxID=35761 RepID=UPI002E362929|nr:dipeptidase [Nocardioides sp.]HEX3932600.1 dipeptidase [Nocardioides sp.]
MTLSLDDLLAADPVMDGHNDLLWAMRDLNGYDFAAYDVGERQTQTHTDIPRLRDGGVGAQFWSVFVPCREGERAVRSTLEQIDAAYTMIERYADQLALATSAEEVEAAWQAGRIACLMGAEGGHQIAESLAVLRMYHRLGVRYLTLTHNDNTSWADSATDEPVLGGLSDFGREVVREMNRIGMLVDLSHVSHDVMRDALDTTAAPAIFSHSSAFAVCDHPRNVPDDVLARLAGNGGTCLVTFVPRFVSQAARDWALVAQDRAAAEGIDTRDIPSLAAVERVYAQEVPAPRATLADVVAHVEHVREVAGIDHVGLGGDFDGVDVLPEGLQDVTGYPRLLAALRERGWSDQDLAKLTSRNVLRSLRDTESVARVTTD